MPVVISDKNGKITTVHRSMSQQASGAKSSIPAPAVNEASGMTAVEAFSALQDCGVTLSDTNHGIDNISHLGKAHPKLLKQLVEAVEESDERTRSVWKHTLGTPAFYPDHDNDDTDYSSYYRRFIHTTAIGTKLHPDATPDQCSRRIRDLVRVCEQKIGWSTHQKRYYETKAAMIVVATSANPYRFEFKGHMEDIFFIADNLEKVEPLIPEILKRRETSRGYIEALMENKAAALTDGLL